MTYIVSYASQRGELQPPKVLFFFPDYKSTFKSFLFSSRIFMVWYLNSILFPYKKVCLWFIDGDKRVGFFLNQHLLYCLGDDSSTEIRYLVLCKKSKCLPAIYLNSSPTTLSGLQISINPNSYNKTPLFWESSVTRARIRKIYHSYTTSLEIWTR